MASNVLRYYNLNPYNKDKTRQNVVIFSATGYQARCLTVSISPIGIRVLLVLVGKLNGEGYATSTLNELADDLQTPRTYVNKGILELARFDFIRKRRRSEYWVDPNIFRLAIVEF